jgi:hypothetical protein
LPSLASLRNTAVAAATPEALPVGKKHQFIGFLRFLMVSERGGRHFFAVKQFVSRIKLPGGSWLRSASWCPTVPGPKWDVKGENN